MLLFVGLTGCLTGGAPVCGPEECADLCAADGGPATAFEESLIDPLLAEIRAGVTPHGDQGLGICRGDRTCDAFLGLDPGELPAGQYRLQAELDVPRAGERGTWTVRFDLTCEGAKPRTYNRTYEVIAPGGDRPYRIPALQRITSPHPDGPSTCSWTLTGPHPDGDKVYQGSWSTP